MTTILTPIQYADKTPVKAQLIEIEKYPIHNHSDLQIMYILEGDLDLKLTFAHYHLSRNSIHIVHSDDVHAITKISEYNLLLVLYISIDYFSNYFPELNDTVFTTKIGETSSSYNHLLLLRDQIFSIVSEQYNKEPGYSSRIIDNTLALLTNLTNHFRGFSVENEHRIFEYKTSHDLFQVDRVSRITSYIYKNYPYKLNLAEIAEREKISVYYLSHLFQKYTGISFRSFLSLVRVEMSESNLLATEDSISKIAQDVGFSDTKYYVENFINWFGHHPKEYRRLFFNQTISKSAPVYKEHSLDRLKESINTYTLYPVFKDTEKNAVIVDVNFKQKKTGAKAQIKSLARIFNNMPSLSIQASVPEKYYKTNPQSFCIQLADFFIKHHRLDDSLLTVMDNDTRQNGILAVNGLKKPVFHFLTMLEKLPADILSSGSNYMVTSDDKMYCILAFNRGEISQTHLTFNILSFPKAVKMTKKQMRAQNTFASYWSQLNFKTDISQEEFETIERMSMPDVSYKIISPQKKYKLNCILEPLDIVMYLFEKL